MGRWVVARLGRALLAAWGIASVVFLLMHLLPTPLEELTLGESSDLSHVGSPRRLADRQAAQRALYHRLGLEEPVFYVSRSAHAPIRWYWHGTHNQYHRWVQQLLRGNLGYSYRTGQPVLALLQSALLYTLPLMAIAIGLATSLAIWLALGFALAPAEGGGWQALGRTLLMSLQAVPLFALALALLLLFANPDLLNILPADGMGTAYPPLGGLAWLAAYGAHLVLPLLSLVLAVLPGLVLPLENALRHELATPYSSTARAKGLTAWQVAYQHALPNALLPLFTTFTGLLPALVAGAVVVEVLFALPGTGRLLAEAAAAHDYPVVLAGVLLTAGARLLALLVADVLYYRADPRLRPSS
ncbi:ABC transporter permease subunit [Hymenobacter sp. HMF4947]|uniref:ABC transporter permease subunit n=1 Tax=Hymenobacter ginkgonis TaxID=2682976 RepID=A0A7K1TEH3_9BACT|nr:ABC transporter permease [Hymenobacter ginkgonis]MVN76818.1 ABC transporter permease subunit [Hymenobacter ginkgonis]